MRFKKRISNEFDTGKEVWERLKGPWTDMGERREMACLPRVWTDYWSYTTHSPRKIPGGEPKVEPNKTKSVNPTPRSTDTQKQNFKGSVLTHCITSNGFLFCSLRGHFEGSDSIPKTITRSQPNPHNRIYSLFTKGKPHSFVRHTVQEFGLGRRRSGPLVVFYV